MNFPTIRAFIQARMSSNRFPGKVLAPLDGKPIIRHVIEQVAKAVPEEQIVVLTSVLESDDPLAGYVQSLGVPIFRGESENVLQRFRSCIEAYPCRWFFRISADSPVLDSRVLRRMLVYADEPDLDLVTNIFPRTYPKGQSVEMIRARRFKQIDVQKLTAEEEEHVTKVYYNHADEYRILNIEADHPITSYRNLAVDTVEDLQSLERWLSSQGVEG